MIRGHVTADAACSFVRASPSCDHGDCRTRCATPRQGACAEPGLLCTDTPSKKNPLHVRITSRADLG